MRAALLLVVLAALPAAAAQPFGSPELDPGQSWSLDGVSETLHYACGIHAAELGMVRVVSDGPSQATVSVTAKGFQPSVVDISPGGQITWTNLDNATHTVSLHLQAEEHVGGRTNLHYVVIWALVVSSVASMVLIVFALRAYRRSADGAMAFVAAGFAIYCLKGALVAYSLHVELIPHEVLELLTAVADTATVLFLVMPILWPKR